MGTSADDRDTRQLWDDAAFLRRAAALAAARGQHVRDISRAAGMSHDYLSRPAPRNGRSIEALLHIAAVLEIDVCELIGIEHGKPPKPRKPPADAETLLHMITDRVSSQSRESSPEQRE